MSSHPDVHDDDDMDSPHGSDEQVEVDGDEAGEAGGNESGQPSGEATPEQQPTDFPPLTQEEEAAFLSWAQAHQQGFVPSDPEDSGDQEQEETEEPDETDPAAGDVDAEKEKLKQELAQAKALVAEYEAKQQPPPPQSYSRNASASHRDSTVPLNQPSSQRSNASRTVPQNGVRSQAPSQAPSHRSNRSHDPAASELQSKRSSLPSASDSRFASRPTTEHSAFRSTTSSRPRTQPYEQAGYSDRDDVYDARPQASYDRPFGGGVVGSGRQASGANGLAKQFSQTSQNGLEIKDRKWLAAQHEIAASNAFLLGRLMAIGNGSKAYYDSSHGQKPVGADQLRRKFTWNDHFTAELVKGRQEILKHSHAYQRHRKNLAIELENLRIQERLKKTKHSSSFDRKLIARDFQQHKEYRELRSHYRFTQTEGNKSGKTRFDGPGILNTTAASLSPDTFTSSLPTHDPSFGSRNEKDHPSSYHKYSSRQKHALYSSFSSPNLSGGTIKGSPLEAARRTERLLKRARGELADSENEEKEQWSDGGYGSSGPGTSSGMRTAGTGMYPSDGEYDTPTYDFPSRYPSRPATRDRGMTPIAAHGTSAAMTPQAIQQLMENVFFSGEVLQEGSTNGKPARLKPIAGGSPSKRDAAKAERLAKSKQLRNLATSASQPTLSSSMLGGLGQLGGAPGAATVHQPGGSRGSTRKHSAGGPLAPLRTSPAAKPVKSKKSSPPASSIDDPLAGMSQEEREAYLAAQEAEKAYLEDQTAFQEPEPSDTEKDSEATDQVSPDPPISPSNGKKSKGRPKTLTRTPSMAAAHESERKVESELDQAMQTQQQHAMEKRLQNDAQKSSQQEQVEESHVLTEAEQAANEQRIKDAENAPPSPANKKRPFAKKAKTASPVAPAAAEPASPSNVAASSPVSEDQPPPHKRQRSTFDVPQSEMEDLDGEEEAEPEDEVDESKQNTTPLTLKALAAYMRPVNHSKVQHQDED